MTTLRDLSTTLRAQQPQCKHWPLWPSAVWAPAYCQRTQGPPEGVAMWATMTSICTCAPTPANVSNGLDKYVRQQPSLQFLLGNPVVSLSKLYCCAKSLGNKVINKAICNSLNSTTFLFHGVIHKRIKNRHFNTVLYLFLAAKIELRF